MNIWVVEAGQFELILYTTCATGSARAVFYGVPKEHGQSPWHTLFKLSHYLSRRVDAFETGRLSDSLPPSPNKLPARLEVVNSAAAPGFYFNGANRGDT